MNEKPAAAKQSQAKKDEAVMIPPVDVYEDSTGITLYADLPGVAKNDLVMQVDADALTIEGEMKLPVPDNIGVTHAEVSVPRYRRVFTLSRELDTEKIAAEFKQGVLKLRIPKAEHAQPRKIRIAVE
jgi:HSP20 family molecular chaperone IbpA